MTKKYFLTGGAGFIGANYVDFLLDRGEEVIVYDNLTRRGSPRNIEWLRRKHGKDSFELVMADVRDKASIASATKGVDVVVHLASQVAVTTSVERPREDFEINALGTFNALEAARHADSDPIFLYASTNKVYGGMEGTKVVEDSTRYSYADLKQGVPETFPLDFHSPYGCSKGSGDQYSRDYYRIYNLRTVVMRQSCIYGPRQFGVEDQGWVAWFAIAAVTGSPITIYGDGKQVRDLLHVNDMIKAYEDAIEHIDVAAGQVYNIGGGKGNTLSVWHEFGPLLEKCLGQKIDVSFEDWRPGDQRIYICDIRKAKKELGWKPKIDVESGVAGLVEWVQENKELFE